MAAGVISSPLTATGMAGGQDTVGMAHTRPSALCTGTRTCAPSTACRMVQRCAPPAAARRQTPLPGSRGGAARQAQQPKAVPAPFAERVKVLRRVFRGEHQHHIAGVGILALQLCAAQSICQRCAGAAKGSGVQRKLHRLLLCPGNCQRHRALPRRCGLIQAAAQTFQRRAALHQPPGGSPLPAPHCRHPATAK